MECQNLILKESCPVQSVIFKLNLKVPLSSISEFIYQLSTTNLNHLKLIDKGNPLHSFPTQGKAFGFVLSATIPAKMLRKFVLIPPVQNPLPLVC